MVMGILRFVIAIFVVALLSNAAVARSCHYKKGEDRWGIKTSLPQGALSHDPTHIGLATFMELENPPMTAAQKRALAKKRWSKGVELDGHVLHEGDMIEVEGYLYRAGCKPDGDYHLEIGTSSDSGKHCLIVELPDAGQVADQILRQMVKRAHKELNTAPAKLFGSKFKQENPVPIVVSGQFFLDAHHLSKTGGNPSGGRGSRYNGKNCAVNVWEIHPVTGIQIGG